MGCACIWMTVTRLRRTHRGHGHCIAKGVDPEGMMLEIYGKKDGLCGGKGGSMHIADLSKGMMGANGIVGGGPPLICGAALTAKTLKTGGVAIAFVGDGASNPGHDLRKLQPRQGLEPAGCVHRRGQWLCREHGERLVGRREPGGPGRRLRDTFSRGGRSRFLCGLGSGARSHRSCEVRQRSLPSALQAQSLLRPFRGRRDHLQGARRDRQDQGGEGLPDAVQAARDRSGTPGRRRDGRDREGEQGHDRGLPGIGQIRPICRRKRTCSPTSTPTTRPEERIMPNKSYRQAINEALRQEMERDERVIIMGEDVAGGMGAPGRGRRLGRSPWGHQGSGADHSAGTGCWTRRSPRAPSSAARPAPPPPVCDPLPN